MSVQILPKYLKLLTTVISLAEKSEKQDPGFQSTWTIVFSIKQENQEIS